jgi:hypothetical protein
LVQGVRFDTSEPLLVTVAVGAVMVGKVKPTGVYRELLRLAHLDEASAPNHKSPGFRIVGASGDAFPAPSEPAVLLRSDGSFRIDGAPPGRSKLLLQYSWSYGGFSVTGATEQVAELDLRDGETSQVDVDLGSFVTGELDAVVTHNGVPLANEVIFVGRGRPGGVVGSIGASTDGQGRLRLRERPGVFHFTWHRQGQPQVRCEGTAVLASGQTTSTTIAFATGEVRVRLLDPAGAPVAGLRLGARGLGDTNSVQLPASDRDGSVTTSLGPGAWSLTALPRRLLDPAALQAFAQAHRGDPGAYVRELLLIGDILVKPGATTDLELHLPPAWAQ